MIFIYSLIAALSVMLVSLIGVLFVWGQLGSWLEKNLKYLVAFSAGVFLIVSYNLAEEVVEMAQAASLASLFISSGFALFLLLDILLPEAHHHHEENEDDEPHSRSGAQKMLIGDGLHNIGDGIILAPAFLAGPVFGLLTTLGILVHEAIQEISEFFVLRQAGYTTKEALIRNFIVSATILIGLAAGFSLSRVGELTAPLIGLAAGGFFYVVLIDLIPRAITTGNKASRLKSVGAFLTGLAVILVVNFLTGFLGLGRG